jgi:hypothetical protein
MALYHRALHNFKNQGHFQPQNGFRDFEGRKSQVKYEKPRKKTG